MSVEYKTLAELAMGIGSPDITNVVDEITKSTTILPDASFQEATGMLENQGMRKLSLPTNKWVAIDQGGTVSKGYKELFKDEMGIIESWSAAHQKEMMIAPNPERVESEDQMDHVASMGLEVESCLLYGGAEPGEFKGIMPRFTSITSDFSKPSFITIDNGGLEGNDGALASVLMVVWGRGGANMLTPRYSATSGINIVKGSWQNVVVDSENYWEKKTQFMMMTGLSLANRYSVIRIANIDCSSATVEAQMIALRKNLYKAFTYLPKQFKSRVKIYAPGLVLASLNGYYDSLVKPVTYANAIPQNAIGDIMFDNFVIRQVETMLATEDFIG